MPTPDRSASAAAEDGGFGALFERLQPGSSPVGPDTPTPAEGVSPAGPAPQEPPAGPARDIDDSATEVPPEDSGGVPISVVLQAFPVPLQMDLAAGASSLAAADVVAAGHAVLLQGPSDTAVPDQTRAAEDSLGTAALPDLLPASGQGPSGRTAHPQDPVAIPAEVAKPGPPVPPPARMTGTAPPLAGATPTDGKDDPPGTGTSSEGLGGAVVSGPAESLAPAGRSNPVSAGMPAFWAAREAAEADGGEPGQPAPVPRADKPGSPAAATFLPSPPVDPAMAAPDAEVAPVPDDLRPGPAHIPVIGHAAGVPGPTLPQSQAPVPASLPPQVPAQIAAAIASRPERPLELRLAALELGGLTLNLQQDGSVLRVTVQADRPDTLDLLRRNGDVLVQELRLAGFAGATLSFADGNAAQHRQASLPAAVATGSDLRPMPVALPPTAHVAHSAQGLDLRL